MFILANKFFFKEKITNFFNDYDKAKLDEMSIFSLKIFNQEIIVSDTLEKIALRHLFYLYKEESDKNFPFIYNKNAIKKFKKYEQILKKNKDIIFKKEVHLLVGFLFGWIHKNNKSQFMIKKVLDLTNDSKQKENFWSLIMIWASIDLFEAKELNVIIGGLKRTNNFKIFSKILNWIITIPEINKNFLKIDLNLILSKTLGKIKIDHSANYLKNENGSKFIYVNDFYDFYDRDLKEEHEKNDLSNSIVVYDGNFNQNIEAENSQLTLEYKYKLEEQTSKIDLDYSEYETMIWEPNPSSSIELFTENSKKSILYNSILKKSNKRVKKYIIKQTKNDFFGEKAILGIEYNRHNQIAISLMFDTEYETNKNALIFKNILIVTNSFLKSKNEFVRKVYEKWISQKSLIVAGDEKVDFSIVANILRLLEQKYNIVNVVFKEFNFWTKNLVDEFIVKSKIFSEEIISRIKCNHKIWQNLQAFNGRLFNKEIYFFNEDFHFKQILNFNTFEKDSKWYITRVSNTFPWDNLFSSLACIGKWESSEKNSDAEECECEKAKTPTE